MRARIVGSNNVWIARLFAIVPHAILKLASEIIQSFGSFSSFVGNFLGDSIAVENLSRNQP